jgi:hypothetical protein
MAQFARPSADTSIGSYVDESDGTTDIYTSIDETSASDSDYIQSDSAPSASPYVTALSTIEDPVSSSGHVVRYRYAKSASGGAAIDLTVELREGYTNEGTPGTLIADNAHADISDTFTDGTISLSGAEVDSISDYSDLFLRFVFDQPA